MQTFEKIRSHVTGKYQVSTNDPYVVGVELSLEQGSRHQGLFLAELEDHDGRGYLRVSTAIAPASGINVERALAFNWESRVGYLAINEMDGQPYLHLCENRPFEGLNVAEVDRLILEIGGLGDRMERLSSDGSDLL